MFWGEEEPPASSKWPALSERNFSLWVDNVTPGVIPLPLKNTLQVTLHKVAPQPLDGNKRGKHIAPRHQHYKWQIHRGREGITEHRTGGREENLKGNINCQWKNPLKASPTPTFVLHVITNASKVEDITESPCIETDDSESEQAKNYVMKRQKRETEGKSHLTEEILELRDNKFNTSEEACFRGRSLRSRQCPCLDSALT